jgi:hypothetical protein
MSSVYLGAAIDLASNLNAFQAMTDILLKSDSFKKSLIFRPDTAWSNARNIKDNEVGIDFLMKVNDYALLNADLAVFFISKNVFSAGVAHEIEKRLSVPRTTYIIAEKLGFYTMGQMNRANNEYVHNRRKINGKFARVYGTMEEFKRDFQNHYNIDRAHFADWLCDQENKARFFRKIGAINE